MDLMIVGGGLPLGEVAIGRDDIVDVTVGTERAEDDADEADGGGEAEAIAGWGHGMERRLYDKGLAASMECDTMAFNDGK